MREQLLRAKDKEQVEEVERRLTPTIKPIFDRSIKQKKENISKDERWKNSFFRELAEDREGLINTLNNQPYRKVSAMRKYWGLEDNEARDALDRLNIKYDGNKIVRVSGKLVNTETGETFNT